MYPVLVWSFLLLQCCYGFFASAQQVNIRKYSIENGLVNNDILNIYQDSQGFIWLCTRGGLSRYDGRPTVVGLADKQTHTIKAWLPDYMVHSSSLGRLIEDGAWQVYGNFLIHDGPDDTQDKKEPYASIGCIEVCGGPNGFLQFNNLLISLSGSQKSTNAEKLAEIGSSGNITITYESAVRPQAKKLP